MSPVTFYTIDGPWVSPIITRDARTAGIFSRRGHRVTAETRR